ncbi:MAG: hypothetical protein Q9196_005602 [Gyalolechia fulgens]
MATNKTSDHPLTSPYRPTNFAEPYHLYPQQLVHINGSLSVVEKVYLQERIISSTEPSLSDHGNPTKAELCIKDSKYFAALQIHKTSGEWQKWHDIEADGSIGNIQDWIDTNGRQGLLSAAKEGLAAGKLWIKADQAAPDERNFMCSGFCLERDLFVTAKHFLRGHGRCHAAHLQLKDPQTAQAYISVWRKSEAPSSHDSLVADPTLRRAFLIEWDEQLDVAIFRLAPGEDQWPRSIKVKQLTPPMSYISRQIFSVGYASSLQGEGDVKNFQTFLRLTPIALLEKGRTADAKQYLALDDPEYEDIFSPNCRALAFGQMLGAVPGTEGRVFHHTIPGWYGLSGSMIGAVGPELEVRIIGMFKGGDVHEEPNQLVPFTESVLQIIRKARSMP